MCGRYYLDTLPETLMEHFSITGVPSLEARYNIAPTQRAPIVRRLDGETWCSEARWGLIPFWAKDPAIGNRMINARAETVAEKPAFRAAWKRRRCLVPASGFYEWQRLGGGKRPAKQPWAIHPARSPLFAFGGIWESWNDPDGETIESYAILTTRASASVEPIHDRMPVFVEREAFDHWLSADDSRQLEDLLAPAGDAAIAAHRVSREVNRPANDHPGLLEPVDGDEAT